MRTTSEAPVAEPQSVKRSAGAAREPGGVSRAENGHAAGGSAVELEGLEHSFDELEVIQRLDLRVRAGEVLGSGVATLEQVERWIATGFVNRVPVAAG